MKQAILAAIAAIAIGFVFVGSQCVAQSNVNGATRVVTLGTLAGPVPMPHRAQSSNLLIVNNTYYVVDAGDGVTRRLAKTGINMREIGTVFLTHLHDDHTAGLGTLMSEVWDLNRTKPINVYGPPGTETLVHAAIEYFDESAEIRIADGGRSVPISQVFFGHNVGPGVVYQDANVKVTAIENTHYAFHNDAGKDKRHRNPYEDSERGRLS